MGISIKEMPVLLGSTSLETSSSSRLRFRLKDHVTQREVVVTVTGAVVIVCTV